MKVLYSIEKLKIFYVSIVCIWLVGWTAPALAAPLATAAGQGSVLLKSSTILVLGDSLSSGYGINPTLGWVSLLEQRLAKQQHYKVVNASVSGETAGGGLARLPALLLAHLPDIMIVELGGNDGLRGYPLKGLHKQLSEIVQLAKQADAKVVLLGMKMLPNYGKRYTDKFEATFVSIAKEYDLAFVPFFLEGVAANANLMQLDNIHPNEAAQSLLLENLWPALKPLLESQE